MGHALIPSRPESTPLFSRHFRRPPARPAAHSLWIPRLSLLRWGRSWTAAPSGRFPYRGRMIPSSSRCRGDEPLP